MTPRRRAPRRSGRGGRAVPGPPPESLRRLGIAPRKALGQHFLIDEFVLGDIAEACRLDASSTVLEVGAGTGALTDELAARAGRVVAVELDEELAAILRRRMAGRPAATVVAADVLDFTPEELLEEGGGAPPYVACGNLPYHITQPVIRRLTEAATPPERIVITVQLEVAQRIVGGAGNESLLSLAVRAFGPAELLLEIPPEAFWPPPKVRSAVLRIEYGPNRSLALPFPHRQRLFNLLRAGFSEPRKQVHNSLSSALGLEGGEVMALLAACDIDPVLRAQHVVPEQWRRLYDAVEQDRPDVLDAG